jgi:hypothetical protein
MDVHFISLPNVKTVFKNLLKNFGILLDKRMPKLSLHLHLKDGPVVQLVRMPACHAGGRGFESRPDRWGVPVNQ